MDNVFKELIDKKDISKFIDKVCEIIEADKFGGEHMANEVYSILTKEAVKWLD